MSFLSVLGKIGKGALGLVPGGGTLSTVLDAAGTVGSVLGKQQEGKAQGQVNQAQLNQGQDRNAISLYQAQQAAENEAAQRDLQRKQFDLSSRNTNAKSALIAALLNGGFSPTSVAGGTASGGLASKLRVDPDAMAAMRNLTQQADSAQMTPNAYTGGRTIAAPTLTQLPQVDKGGFLSTLAQIGQLAGAASPYVQDIGASMKKKTPTPYQYDEAGD